MNAPAHPQEYIITEEQIKDLLIAGKKRDKTDEIKILNDVFCRPHSSVQSRDQVLDEVIKIIRKKVSLPTNSGEQISCDASIRLGIIHDINAELRTQGSRDP